MTRLSIVRVSILCALAGASSVGVLAPPNTSARDPRQPIDEEYTK